MYMYVDGRVEAVSLDIFNRKARPKVCKGTSGWPGNEQSNFRVRQSTEKLKPSNRAFAKKFLEGFWNFLTSGFANKCRRCYSL